jgi:hypothetical protein
MAQRTTAFTAALFGVVLIASAAGAQTQSNPTTVIHGQYRESHILMNSDNYKPIVWTNDFTVTLSGRNSIHEEWHGVNQRNIETSNSGDLVLGSTAGSVTWRVIGPATIRKIVEYRQHTMVLTINTSADKTCKLDVEFKLKPGFTDMLMPRADNHELSHFTLPKLMDASCSIS